MKDKRKRELYSVLLALLIIGISLGYAALSATLNINGSSQIKENTWDIHFNNVKVSNGSVTLSTGDSAATITPNNTTEVTYAVTLSKPGDFYEFTVDAVNAGTIDGMIESVTSKFNNIAIDNDHPLPVYLEYSVSYKDDIPIENNHLLEAGHTDTYKVRLEFKKDIEESVLPENDITSNLSFEVKYVQRDENAIPRPQQPVIGPPGTTSNTYRSSTYREKIKTITLEDEVNPPTNPVESWDIGVAQNGNVMAYLTVNSNDNTMYNLIIQGDGHLYANSNSSSLFDSLTKLDSINNISVLDTSKVTNMYQMFSHTGHDSTTFTLDLGSNFDTSNVTSMYGMFDGTGFNSTSFTLNLGNKFDTSKVTNMYYMFRNTGYSSTVFTLDLGDKFDTSNVEYMNSMFYQTGYNNTSFTLDLGNKFDTSKVKNMGRMFYYTGYKSTIFTIDLGDKFDTSKVTNMSEMFYCLGSKNSTFTLDLGSKFDTSIVTDMSYMFMYIGNSNSTFELDLSTFDFSSVTNYSSMFEGFKTTNKIYVKNVNDQTWVIDHKETGRLSTSNVLIKQ